MAGTGALTGTYDVYDAGTASITGGSNREDLSDIIYNIAPTETPFLMLAGRGTARGAKHEWLTDTLEAATANYVFEGDEQTFAARTAPARLSSYTQISTKNLIVTGTQEAVDKAGRKSEIAYQLALKAKELKRDMERQIIGFTAAADSAIDGVTGAGETFPNEIGTASEERVTASVGTWTTLNSDANGATLDYAGTGALADGDSTTGGTARALLESALKEVIRESWVQGGNPSTIIVDAFNKQVISSFTGGTTRFDKSEDKRLVTAIDVYVSDFGDHTVIPDRFLINNDATPSTIGTAAWILDMNYWEVAYLRPFQQTPLAKTGDAEKRLMLAEWTLCAKNPAASGAVFNLSNG